MSGIHSIAFLIGRVIAGGFFLTNGFNHFAQRNMLIGYAKSKGIPAPPLAVGGSGVLLLLGGLSLLLGYHPTIGVALLAIFLLGVSFGLHNFLDDSRPTSKDRGDDQLSKKHGHTRSAADDVGHPGAVADESWSLILAVVPRQNSVQP